jgi:GT2 family glycosyltransferase
MKIAREEEAAGFTVYSWSDRWWNNGAEVLDWDFGLIDRGGNDKPALAALSSVPPARPDPRFFFSVIVCTRNGRERIGGCLAAVGRMAGRYETIVVDDGSEDGTADFVARKFPSVRLLRLDPGGLSAARNIGAAAATGEILAFTDDDCEPDREWLVRLERVFAGGRFAAAGGPNLPPKPRIWQEAVVCAAPGAPSHVMLDDVEAEHLPGCNLAVTKIAFRVIGGFDPVFHTAGDDVDFCWRLREAGFRLGFAPGAFVWHWRRPSIRGFLKQQIGYGRAERLLIAKHPAHFNERGVAKWQGFIYGGGPVRVAPGSIIYHGPMGAAGYQSVQNRMLPLRGLDGRFDSWHARLALRLVQCLAPLVRAFERSRELCLSGCRVQREIPVTDIDAREIVLPGVSREEVLARLLADGWQPGGPTDGWDAEKTGVRILAATEHGDRGYKQTLSRVWGDVSLMPAGVIDKPVVPWCPMEKEMK